MALRFKQKQQETGKPRPAIVRSSGQAWTRGFLAAHGLGSVVYTIYAAQMVQSVPFDNGG